MTQYDVCNEVIQEEEEEQMKELLTYLRELTTQWLFSLYSEYHFTIDYLQSYSFNLNEHIK